MSFDRNDIKQESVTQEVKQEKSNFLDEEKIRRRIHFIVVRFSKVSHFIVVRFLKVINIIVSSPTGSVY